MAVEYLVLLHEPRVCKRCHERTYWTLESLLWSDKGICLPHAGEVWERIGPVDERAAFRAIVRALGPVSVGTDEPAPDVFTAERVSVRLYWTAIRSFQRLCVALTARYVGRCAGCHTAIRRYGPHGRPLCDACAVAKP